MIKKRSEYYNRIYTLRNSMTKFGRTLQEMVPVLLMISLIPILLNDYVLSSAYTIIIIFSLLIKREKYDKRIFLVGFILMTFFEFVFINTGVEIFLRNSFFGMPLWLPILWGYGFVAIKRVLNILEEI